MRTMYKVTVILSVATGEWQFHEGNKFAGSYMTFTRELELPFPPCVGLQLSSEDWISDPLESVRYDVDGNYFACHVPGDNEIPDKLEHFFISGEKTDTELDKYVKNEVEIMKDVYVDLGWKLHHSSYKECNA